jgi:hypothetical protein
MTLVLFRRDPLWRGLCGVFCVCRLAVVMVFAQFSTNKLSNILLN